jgi:hypothetical protein
MNEYISKNEYHVNMTICGMLSGIFFSILGLFMGLYCASESSRNAAVNAGVAEYHLDKSTGDIRFGFIKPNTHKP